MDLSKYLSLLQASSLFFSRVDRMNDPYEGAMSHANKDMRPAVYRDEIPDWVFETRSQLLHWERQWTFINCWHMNENESDAMWRLYAKTADAVAVQSTYAKLHAALPEQAFLGIVQYIDYETEWMAEGNLFYPFVHKRKSFEHERDLRALIQDPPRKADPTGGVGAAYDYVNNLEDGRSVPIELALLVESVFVAPTSPAWFRDIVAELTRKYELAVPVQQSALDRTPEF